MESSKIRIFDPYHHPTLNSLNNSCSSLDSIHTFIIIISGQQDYKNYNYYSIIDTYDNKPCRSANFGANGAANINVYMTVTSNTMTSCLPGADSGGSQGSGLASINDSTMGSGSVNASPVLSPTGEPGGNTNPGGPISSFSATRFVFDLALLLTKHPNPVHNLRERHREVAPSFCFSYLFINLLMSFVYFLLQFGLTADLIGTTTTQSDLVTTRGCHWIGLRQ